jgi:hypothetical protein
MYGNLSLSMGIDYEVEIDIFMLVVNFQGICQKNV